MSLVARFRALAKFYSLVGCLRPKTIKFRDCGKFIKNLSTNFQSGLCDLEFSNISGDFVLTYLEKATSTLKTHFSNLKSIGKYIAISKRHLGSAIL